MQNRLAVIGLVIGIAAVGLAAFRNNFIYEPLPPEPPKSSWKQVASEAAKTIVEEKVLHKEPPKRPSGSEESFQLPLHPYQMVYTGLGLLALTFGVIAWCRKEHIRMAGGAAALGLMAICWQWVAIAVGVAVGVFVLANLAS